MEKKFLCFQIGAREHYGVARELHRDDTLALLVTDYWAGNKYHIIKNKNLQGRRHDGIPDQIVHSFNLSFLIFELVNRIRKSNGWDLVMKRNHWFQHKAVAYLKHNEINATHVFCYSYAAADILAYAKSKGWTTILGQIDPGPLEEEIVMDELRRYPEYQSEWQPAPQEYWQNWERECELADTIMVNSEWSKKALLARHVPNEKIVIQPLVYTPDAETEMFERSYPDRFTKERPLRVLFLGQVILRKGIARIIEAAKALVGEPITFIIAGPVGIHPIPALPNLQVVGRVSRTEVHNYYRDADVFLFPTLSDGFALTQLESFAWKLPVITTPFCGDVVEHQHNGFVMEHGTSSEIQEILKTLLTSPEKLVQMSQHIKDYKTEKITN